MATNPRTMYSMMIGSVQTSSTDIDHDRVTMPSRGPSSYTPQTNNNYTPKTNDTQPNTVYLIFQHSKASSGAGSPLLPVSNVIALFQSRDDAQVFLRRLKDQDPPVVRAPTAQHGGRRPQFWNTGDGDDEESMGFQYTSKFGEEFVVWIEEHEVRLKGEQKEIGDVGGC